MLRGKAADARRVIGMSNRIEEILRRRVRDSRISEWVFPSRRGGGKNHITTVNKAFAKARREAGLPPNLVLYSTRHTFGTDLMGDTGDLKLTMSAMGHVDFRSSARYQHPNTGKLGQLMNQRNARREAERQKSRAVF